MGRWESMTEMWGSMKEKLENTMGRWESSWEMLGNMKGLLGSRRG